jgi:hypothetical protein
MKFRGLMTTAAAAMLCVCTLGCPPAEDDTVPPVEVDVIDTDDNATEAAPIVDDSEPAPAGE